MLGAPDTSDDLDAPVQSEPAMNAVRIVGRSSSLFTRVARIFAEELGVPYQLVPIHDMATTDPHAYAGNPALKLPILKTDSFTLYGAQNICRALAEQAGSPVRIVWPDQLHDHLHRNAQELVWHAMAAQVQLVMGTVIAKLPADNAYFLKGRAGLENSLRWLDDNIARTLSTLPPRDLSLFEVCLFCLVDHLAFRETVGIAQHANLARFSHDFAQRPSAQRTPYRFDQPS